MNASPKLSLCMIVRDEEEFLGRCLASVRAVVDEIIVVDTGSADRTAEIARSYGARVFNFTWRDDFAAARNFSLDRATGDWILYLDADEELVLEDAARLRPLLDDPNVNAYLFQTISFTGDTPGPARVSCVHLRLFRNRPEHRYVGAIHERLPIDPHSGLAYRNLRILHYGYLTGVVRSKGKIARNLKILRHLAARDPDDPFTLYNLGTEYLRQGHNRQAARAFARAQKLIDAASGWAPELAKKYAICLMELGDYTGALDQLNKSLEVYPDYADLVFLQGCCRHRQKLYSSALAAFGRCCEMGSPPIFYPSDDGVTTYQAVFCQGLVHQDLKNYNRAVEYYLQALKMKPDYRPPLLCLVQALTVGENDRELLTVISERLECPADARFFLATHLAAARRYTLAQEQIGLIGEKAVPPAELSLLRGICLLGIKRLREAAEILMLISPDSPAYPRALLHLCLCDWLGPAPREASVWLRRLGRVPGWRVESEVYGRFHRLVTGTGRDTGREAAFSPVRAKRHISRILDLTGKLFELDRPDLARLAVSMAGECGERPESLAQVGRMAADFGYFFEAEEFLRKARMGGLRDVAVELELAALRIKSGQLRSAGRSYREILEAHPQSLESYLGWARAFIEGAVKALDAGGNKFRGMWTREVQALRSLPLMAAPDRLLRP